MQQNASPVGATTREGSARRRSRSEVYRETEQRLAPLEQLARLVILHRARLGLSQQALADRVGTTASAISRLESGHHRVNLDTLQRVAEGLELRAVVGFEIPGDDAPAAHELVTL